MTTFTLKIDTDNDAFTYAGSEVARILREVADQMEGMDDSKTKCQTVRDINGNDVGRYWQK